MKVPINKILLLGDSIKNSRNPEKVLTEIALR